MISISIIEAELYLRTQLKMYIDELPGFDVVSVSADVATSIALIEQHKPQVILSDIRLLDGNAFDTLCQVKHKTYALIFITAFEEYALKAIKFGAFDYLLKPLNKTELHIALKRIAIKKLLSDESVYTQSNYRQDGDQYSPSLVIRTTNTTYFLIIIDIVYCVGEGNYTTFVMKDGERIVVGKNIEEYEMLLPKRFFIRTHQSYIVNVIFVKQMHRGSTLCLTDIPERIPVSIHKKKILLDCLSNMNPGSARDIN